MEDFITHGPMVVALYYRKGLSWRLKEENDAPVSQGLEQTIGRLMPQITLWKYNQILLLLLYNIIKHYYHQRKTYLRNFLTFNSK